MVSDALCRLPEGPGEAYKGEGVEYEKAHDRRVEQPHNDDRERQKSRGAIGCFLYRRSLFSYMILTAGIL